MPTPPPAPPSAPPHVQEPDPAPSAAEPEEAATQADRAESAGAKSRQKKERVLHTRIPAVLEEELKAAADALRIPVSNLVRTILEDAVAIADRATGRVEERLERAARTVRDERERMRARVERSRALDGVVAWQPVHLAQPARCASCAASLASGAAAALGITERPGPRVFVCPPCVPTQGTSTEPETREE
ncbi:MAG: hypothetical protein IT376_13190 [Polyangiaceae bacterium]|nr:hypothetical protein [Polyangiaceae bacterium]